MVLDCNPQERAKVLEYSLAALHYAHLSGNYSIESCRQETVCTYNTGHDQILHIGIYYIIIMLNVGE